MSEKMMEEPFLPTFDSVKDIENKSKSGLFGTIANVFNSIVGPAFLALPYAILQGGKLTLAVVLFVGFSSCYVGKLIIRCMLEPGTSKIISQGHSDVAYRVWGDKGRLLVDILLIALLFGVCTMCIVLIGTSMNNLVPTLTSAEWCLVTGGSLLIIVTFAETLSHLSYLSTIGAISMFISLGLVLVDAFDNLENDMVKNWNELPFATSKLPLACAIIIFSFDAQPLLPDVMKSMKEPKKFPFMLNITFAFVSTLKAIFGTIPVLAFGNSVQQAINTGLHNYYYRITVSSLVVLNTLLTYPLPMFPLQSILHSIFSKYILKKFNKKLPEIVTKWIIVFSTTAVASSFPKFAIVVAFCGAIANSSLSFILPCICSIKLGYSYNVFEKIWQIILIIFGFLAMGLGVANVFLSEFDETA